MKKINLKFTLIFFALLLSLSSCSNDDGESVPDYGISTGNYFPLTENNKWWYLDDGEVKLIAISTINYFDNIPYYRIYNSNSDLESWMIKKGASYFQKSGDTFMNLSNGNTLFIGEYEIKLLKDDVLVGGNWSDNLTLDIKVYGGGTPVSLPATLSYTSTILERNATETIEGNTYTNVIKVHMYALETVNSQNTIIESEYWFAKDIGLIKEITTSSTDNITKVSYLTSYELN
jgi:hypothetical protein